MAAKAHYDVDDLISFVDEELAPSEMAGVRKHIGECPECSERVAVVRQKLEFFDERFTLSRLEQIDARGRACAALEAARVAMPGIAERLARWIRSLEDMFIPQGAWEPQYVGVRKGGEAVTRIRLSPERPLAELNVPMDSGATVEVYYQGASGLLMVPPAGASGPAAPEIRERTGAKCEAFALSPGRYLFVLEPVR